MQLFGEVVFLVDRCLVGVGVKTVEEILVATWMQDLQVRPPLQFFHVVHLDFLPFFINFGDCNLPVEVSKHVVLGFVGLVGKEYSVPEVTLGTSLALDGHGFGHVGV